MVYDSLVALCQQYGIDILYVFGSRAKEVKAMLENNHPPLQTSTSDVDIGIKPSKAVKFSVRQKVKLAQALEDLLGVSRVDLILLPEAAPFLAANIICGERLYASNEYLADEYDLYILRRAGDFIPLEKERLALIMDKRS
ncbi:MAG: hypothetical protein JW908_04915 [Anaerolineales bacterium]|nr:hypothetical protein [Anaerolineales bacterium]